MSDDTTPSAEDAADAAAMAADAHLDDAHLGDGGHDDGGADLSVVIAGLGITSMSLQELKAKSPADLLALAE